MNLDALFAPFPVIATDRLVLRRLDTTNLEDAATYFGDRTVGRHTTWQAYVIRLGLDRFMALLEGSLAAREMALWAIRPVNAACAIGFCGFTVIAADDRRAEIGYAVARAYWGRGYAPEAARALIDYALSIVGFNRIEAYCSVGNAASLRVLEKIGMRREGILRQHTVIDGQLHDRAVYAVLSSDWSAAAHSDEALPRSRRRAKTGRESH